MASSLEDIQDQVVSKLSEEYLEAVQLPHDDMVKALMALSLRVIREADTIEKLKTAEMFRLERRFGASIYDLLAPKGETGKELGKRFGVSESVISRWRKRLGIRVLNPGQYTRVGSEGRH